MEEKLPWVRKFEYLFCFHAVCMWLKVIKLFLWKDLATQWVTCDPGNWFIQVELQKSGYMDICPRSFCLREVGSKIQAHESENTLWTGTRDGGLIFISLEWGPTSAYGDAFAAQGSFLLTCSVPLLSHLVALDTNSGEEKSLRCGWWCYGTKPVLSTAHYATYGYKKFCKRERI